MYTQIKRMFRKGSKMLKIKGRRERLVLLASLMLCGLFVFHLLYTELAFKDTHSQHIQFTDQRQFLSIDRKPDDVSTTVDKDVSYEIEDDASTVVNQDVSYEIKQDTSTEVNKDVSYEIEHDASTVVNKGVSSDIYQDTSTIDNMDMFDAVKKDDHNQSLQYLLTRLIGGENRTKMDSTGYACDINSWSTVCVTNKPVTIDTSTMQVQLQQSPDTKNTTTVVRPYAIYANEYTTQVTITTTKPTRPTCDHNHQHPAVIFSTGGFTGNTFHEFDETIIPLFITTRLFKSRVHFLVVDYRPSFFQRYGRILQHLSDHEIINTATNSSVHCFPGAVIGLKFHYFQRINMSETPQNYYSMLDFREFIRQTYRLKIKSVFNLQTPHKLIIISRQRSRKFLNQEEMVKMMEELGFEVIIASSAEEMSNIEKFSQVVNSCSVMVGTHGAGLTNQIFLPHGAVMIQVRLFGIEGGVDAYFSEPAPEMGLQYLEYKMKPEESSLVDDYGIDHPVLQDTGSVVAKGWEVAAAMYLEKQNVRLDINRFKETLVEALGLIGHHKNMFDN